jgi:hypothetical protein
MKERKEKNAKKRKEGKPKKEGRKEKKERKERKEQNERKERTKGRKEERQQLAAASAELSSCQGMCGKAISGWEPQFPAGSTHGMSWNIWSEPYSFHQLPMLRARLGLHLHGHFR